MRIPFIIYAQAFIIYLILTLPSIVEPAIYFISAVYAFTSGFAAMLVFVAVFFTITKTRTRAQPAKFVLAATALIAVAAAYKLLLATIMPERSFWVMDEFTAFPVLAVLCGWLAIGLNLKKISAHFDPPPVVEGFETIFTYNKTNQI